MNLTAKLSASAMISLSAACEIISVAVIESSAWVRSIQFEPAEVSTGATMIEIVANNLKVADLCAGS